MSTPAALPLEGVNVEATGKEKILYWIFSFFEISSSSNDLGFTYDESLKEFLMYCSDYDCKIGISDKVKQSYAITAIKKALIKNKFSIKEETKTPNL